VNENSQNENTDSPRFNVFRAKQSEEADDISILQSAPLSAEATEGASRLVAAGINSGHWSELLFSLPGYSLIKLWFKSNYPLPRHCHNVDCLYYITAGSLRIGNEVLNAGDGFFIAANTAYSYIAGSKGVEILEFRASDNFDIKLLVNGSNFWAKALQSVEANVGKWADEPRPSALPNKTS